MTKRFIKWCFYLIYVIGGSFIAYFLPENSRFIFGFVLSAITRWGWVVITSPERKEVSNG